MFNYRSNVPHVDGLTDTELNDAWKSWARQEEVVRYVTSVPGEAFESGLLMPPEPCLGFTFMMLCLRACFTTNPISATMPS